ncbi:hypothetical protein DPSP01_002405 [Paraphaeosphaeria sporulosa]|uniref:Cyclin-dependent kinase n=1 Tax=Paraphaeosphaeria sporulosa TaxID=1460663 RepID=A0A177C2P1_9PLEO|nr:uncharacterized protein CC84DRAFT_276880 [Paraphaeosphaeria sporulosa]OAG01122.1 hypothetical protein CC84DRAFT_276880 [Paraphaeosphaeria sporulosa]
MTAPMPSLYQRELPDSQESYISAASSTFSAPRLPSASSNLSTSTAGDTEITSPPLSKTPSAQKTSIVHAFPPSPDRPRGPDTLRIDAANAPRTGDTAASPMSLDSPAMQGLKRAADGSVKGSEIINESPTAPTMGHKRNKSMEAGSSGRIGQLSAQLKTRLSYAMVKVQNNWEKQSIDELEERISQQGSPNSVANRTPGSRPAFASPTTAERRRRPSGVSENSDHMMISPGQRTPSDPSRSYASTPSSLWRPGTKPTLNAAVNLISVTGANTGLMLGPAPEFESRRKRRSSASFHAPPLLGSSQRKHFSDLGAGLRTPATPRPGILRMPSQQAEKDAVDTLLFMSSPNNSGRLPHTSADARAARHDFEHPQRRVMFENFPSTERPAGHLHSSAPSSQSTAYYRAEPSR